VHLSLPMSIAPVLVNFRAPPDHRVRRRSAMSCHRYPPTIRTLPLGSRVAVCKVRAIEHCARVGKNFLSKDCRVQR